MAHVAIGNAAPANRADLRRTLDGAARNGPSCYNSFVDREARAREIVAAARARTRTSRSLWIVAIVVSVLCVGALAVALFQDRDTVAEKPLTARPAEPSSGFRIGLLLGLGVGIAIGGVVVRRRGQDRSSHSSRNMP